MVDMDIVVLGNRSIDPLLGPTCQVHLVDLSLVQTSLDDEYNSTACLDSATTDTDKQRCLRDWITLGGALSLSFKETVISFRDLARWGSEHIFGQFSLGDKAKEFTVTSVL